MSFALPMRRNGWDEAARLAALAGQYESHARLRAGAKQARVSASIARRFLWQQARAPGGPLSVAAVAGYLAALREAGRGLKTLLNHRSALSGFFAFLHDSGVAEADPGVCCKVRLGRLDEQVPRWLDAAEAETALAAARAAGVWPEVATALATGLRVGELVRLEWADVDESLKILRVRKSKSHRFRAVPLSGLAVQAVAQQRRITGGCRLVFPARRGGWHPGPWLDRERGAKAWRNAIRPLQDAVGKFRQAVGCGRGWHLLRHTFASRLAQAGVSLYKIAQWMGHSDVRMTRVYAHLQGGYDADIERT